MKASKCFWVALCLLVGNFSTELWAQKNLEAVVQKCKADKTIDKSVVTNKDPKTKKVYKIVSSFVVDGQATTPHYNKKLNPLLSGTRKRLIK